MNGKFSAFTCSEHNAEREVKKPGVRLNPRQAYEYSWFGEVYLRVRIMPRTSGASRKVFVAPLRPPNLSKAVFNDRINALMNMLLAWFMFALDNQHILQPLKYARAPVPLDSCSALHTRSS